MSYPKMPFHSEPRSSKQTKLQSNSIPSQEDNKLIIPYKRAKEEEIGIKIVKSYSHTEVVSKQKKNNYSNE